MHIRLSDKNQANLYLRNMVKKRKKVAFIQIRKSLMLKEAFLKGIQPPYRMNGNYTGFFKPH